MRPIAAMALAICLAALPARAIDLLVTNPLYDPVIAGDTDKVARVLGTGGSYVDSTLDEEGKTALMLAAAAGNDAMVDLLLRYRAKPDARDSIGNTALAYAAARGQIEAAEALLRGRAAIDPENRQGVTPLMQAAQQGQAAMVRFLLARGADSGRRDYTGRSALMWAEFNRRATAVAVFRRAGVTE
jgi:ankyrin repeat protein